MDAQSPFQDSAHPRRNRLINLQKIAPFSPVREPERNRRRNLLIRQFIWLEPGLIFALILANGFSPRLKLRLSPHARAASMLY